MGKRKNELENKIKIFIKLLENNFSLETVILFGSYASGKPNKWSDVDIAVFSRDFGKNPLEEMASLCKLRRQVDTNIEPLPFSDKELHKHDKADFIHEILTKGRVLYKNGGILI